MKLTDLRVWGAALGAAGLIVQGWLAWQGSRLAVVLLVVTSLIWVVFCMMNSLGWRRSNESWRSTIDDYGDAINYGTAMGRLLAETLNNLETWDREKAEEIAERATTISLLHVQNIQGRSSP